MAERLNWAGISVRRSRIVDFTFRFVLTADLQDINPAFWFADGSHHQLPRPNKDRSFSQIFRNAMKPEFKSAPEFDSLSDEQLATIDEIARMRPADRRFYRAVSLGLTFATPAGE